jgi:hypothetical protein
MIIDCHSHPFEYRGTEARRWATATGIRSTRSSALLTIDFLAACEDFSLQQRRASLSAQMLARRCLPLLFGCGRQAALGARRARARLSDAQKKLIFEDNARTLFKL